MPNLIAGSGKDEDSTILEAAKWEALNTTG
jgi:hypothetical protein